VYRTDMGGLLSLLVALLQDEMAHEYLLALHAVQIQAVANFRRGSMVFGRCVFLLYSYAKIQGTRAKMKEIYSSETLVPIYQTTWRHIPVDKVK
jgi:hypothetical protein